MKIHILGICGTFMGSLAILARQLGHEVTGCDAHVYPPMSTLLEQQGINLLPGYEPSHLQPHPDLVIVGNAVSRGNPCVEYVLNTGLRYVSGPQWLSEQLLQQRWVLAVAGTHGKTTTTALLAWILQCAGLQPGYLIGGVPEDLPASATLGRGSFFVIEADEYDTAFFDKRSKFVHYHPRTLILNNLEFDHADIFDSIKDIQKQFHHLVRTVPATGRIIYPAEDAALQEVIQMGCWSEQECFSFDSTYAPWHVISLTDDGSEFRIVHNGVTLGEVRWSQTGRHNLANALAAFMAATHAGVMPGQIIEALNRFTGVKRRMEKLYDRGGITVYDDFAHHPTAIRTTLQGLRSKIKKEKLVAVIEPRSNTMRMGVHHKTLADSAGSADMVIWYQPESASWDMKALALQQPTQFVENSLDAVLARLSAYVKSREASAVHIVIMSNGGFGGIHRKLTAILDT